MLFVNEKGACNESYFDNLNNYLNLVQRHIISQTQLQTVVKENAYEQHCLEFVLIKIEKLYNKFLTPCRVAV